MTARYKWDWLDYARIGSGILCLAAGIAKAFPQVEDVAQTLSDMAAANAGTPLAGVSEFIVENTQAAIWLVAFGLAGSGLAFLLGRLLIPAALGQLVMLAAFMTLLFRLTPEIIAIDLPFALIAALVLRRALQRASAS